MAWKAPDAESPPLELFSRTSVSLHSVGSVTQLSQIRPPATSRSGRRFTGSFAT
jgi:hypothetical protein